MRLVRRVEGWRTTDDRLFDSDADAELHQALLDLVEWADGAGIGRGGEWTADMVAQSIFDSAGELSQQLERIELARRQKQRSAPDA